MTGRIETAEHLKNNVLARLKKISGQLNGITNMVENGKECEDILTQVKAVRAALKSMNTVIVQTLPPLTCNQEMRHKTAEEQYLQLENMITILARFME